MRDLQKNLTTYAGRQLAAFPPKLDTPHHKVIPLHIASTTSLNERLSDNAMGEYSNSIHTADTGDTLRQFSENSAAAKTAVSISDFNFFYGTHQALFDISLAIPAQRVTALIGPSGCGKSTFLRSINRMNDSIAGARCRGLIAIGEQDVYAPQTDVVTLRTRVGMVFQKSNPFPKSIFENVAFAPRIHGLRNRTQLSEIVEWSLKKADLWNEVKDRLNTSALALSGGQQQRLCIARALAIGPEILLMDEPASALDPRSTAKIEELIRELGRQYSIVIVTHNMQQAARVSDQTCFFYEGHLIEFGETREMFTKPRERKTEDYITGRFG